MGSKLTRRSVLAAAGATTVAVAAPGTQPADDDALPRATLGKTGLKVTRLIFGASFPDYGPRLLQFAYRQGIRCFDNSHRYVGGKAEVLLGEFARRIKRRDDIIVMTKGKMHEPEPFYEYVTRALDKMKLDTIDIFMVHGITDPGIPLDRDGEWRRLKNRLVREKKIRFMGFSCHAEMPERIECVANAAEGGWVDAMLLACDPALIRSNAELNRAIDACAKADIGMMAMKTGRGLGRAVDQPERVADKFKALELTPHQAMQAGIWSDERFTAVCTEMPNRQFIVENCEGARRFKPFTPDQWKLFDEAVKTLARSTCPGCDGSCRRAAGSLTDFCSITRYLAYAEEDGRRDEARALFADLPPEARDWATADLDAASRACHGRLDFKSILDRAGKLFT